jgi:hypothetical protein
VRSLGRRRRWRREELEALQESAKILLHDSAEAARDNENSGKAQPEKYQEIRRWRSHVDNTRKVVLRRLNCGGSF